MLSRILLPTLAGALFIVTGCQDSEPSAPTSDTPALAAIPAVGNGGKQVFNIDEDLPNTVCSGGEILTVHQTGWIQMRLFLQPRNRNVQLDVVHLATTFTNTAGETFTFTDVGPDHFYFDEQGLFNVSLSGRVGGGEGLFGHLVFNFDTGTITFVAGNQFGGFEALACNALT